MICDDKGRFFRSLHEEHSFVRCTEVVSDYRVYFDDVSSGIRLYVCHYSGSNRLAFYVFDNSDDQNFPCSFDKFFELLPPDQKEVSSWNLHLLK
jgi:hypothetical protein